MKSKLIRTSVDSLVHFNDNGLLVPFKGNPIVGPLQEPIVLQQFNTPNGNEYYITKVSDNTTARKTAKRCLREEDTFDFEAYTGHILGINSKGSLVYRLENKFNLKPKSKIQYLSAEPDLSAIREDTFEGNDYTVVPVIALVEGVIQCMTCPTPELALAKEFANPVEAWNGRPVTMGHPLSGGEPVSASDPKVLENESIGVVFNSKLLENPNRLYAELWLNKSKINSIGDRAKDYLDRILAGNKVEVSTGYFAEVSDIKGEFKGKKYLAVQSNIKPDHIAVLGADEKGACSWEMGCGTPRSNSCGSTCDCAPCMESTKKANKKLADEAIKRHRAAIELNFTTNSKLSFQDTKTAVATALIKLEPNLLWINALYDNIVVYEVFSDMDIRQRTYSIADDGLGAVTFGDDVTIVRPVTQFVPAKNGEKMDKKGLIDSIISNASNQFAEADREFLNGLTEAQLAKFAAVNNADETDETDENEEKEETSTPETNQAPANFEAWMNSAPVEVRQIVTEALTHRKSARKALIKRVLAIKDCKFTEEELSGFDLKMLEKLASMGQAAAAKPHDFAGLGHLIDDSYEGEEDEAVPPTPKVFELKKTVPYKNMGVSKLEKAAAK